jgi:manganese-dependent inorganic pyrophosphatase
MSKVLVFGHQNPDTDAISAAIAFAYLQKKLGVEAEVVALGEPNDETRYALEEFGFMAPPVITKAADHATDVMLVDHNEFQQSVADIRDVNILAVVDHHRIANFETANPLYYRAEPVGCSSTIIYKLFKENNVEIPENIAGIMLSAIISDTLLFKSPTCTPTDVEAAEALAKIAEIDAQTYGLELLKAGTKLSDKTAEVLIDLDAKSFEMGGKTVRIAQVNTADLAEVLARKTELLTAMKASNKADGYDLFALVVTDIVNSNSELIVTEGFNTQVETAFATTLADNRAFLPGVVSRKKQVVPQLTESFNK